MKKKKKLCLILIICFLILTPVVFVYSALSKEIVTQEEFIEPKLGTLTPMREEKLREYLNKMNNK